MSFSSCSNKIYIFFLSRNLSVYMSAFLLLCFIWLFYASVSSIASCSCKKKRLVAGEDDENSKEEEKDEECFPSFALSCSMLLFSRFFTNAWERNDKNDKIRRRKKTKENRGISMRSRAGTSTVGHSGDVVFYASVIVVVILVRLSRDAGRRCCFFFLLFV